MNAFRYSSIVLAVLGAFLVEGAQRPETIERDVSPVRDLGEAQKAVRAAMKVDTTFATGPRTGITRDGAVAAWKDVLRREDLSRGEQVFAWWRIGSLYAYNFDPARGERADYGAAEEAFAEARKLSAGLVSFETLNTATVYGSLPGAAKERARRMAEGFRTLASIGPDSLAASLPHINEGGYLVDSTFFSAALSRARDPDAKQKLLEELLASSRKLMISRIDAEFQYSRDADALKWLLDDIEGVVDPEQMKRWRDMYRKRLEKKGVNRRSHPCRRARC